MKILISGGHLTPALAFIDYVHSKHPEHTAIFIGREWSQTGHKQKSNEKQEISKRGVEFLPFQTPRFTISSLAKTILNLPKLFLSTWRAYRLIKKHKPSVFLSFGGYLAVPVALASALAKIPVVTHEQTHQPGLANKLIGKFAKVVAVSYQETQSYFPEKKTILTGNLIRQDLFKKSDRPSWLPKSSKPLLLITGGNQGARAINKVVAECLSKLTEKYQVVHQHGNPTLGDVVLEKLATVKEMLDEDKQHSYFGRPWFTTQELGWLYQHTRLLVSRSGANTVHEVTIFKLPAVFIPLPTSRLNEQLINAQSLSKVDGAYILEQKNLSCQTLQTGLENIERKHTKMQQSLAELKPEKNGSQNLFEAVLQQA